MTPPSDLDRESDGPGAATLWVEGPETFRSAGSDPQPGGAWFPIGLAAISAIAFAGRLAYLVTSKVDGDSTFSQGDAFWYSTTAQNLANGHWFRNAFNATPTADHPPLTVLILAPVSWLFSGSTLAQRMTMVVLGTITVAVVGLAGRRLAGPVAGLAAAVAAAALPALWVNDVLIMSETPTALLVGLLLWTGIALAERPTARLAVAAGGLCGVAALCRAETGLFLPFMVWPIVLAARAVPWRRRLTTVAMASVATLAVIAPWSVSNLARFDEPVAISTNDGLTLLGASCDETWNGSLAGGWTLTPCVADLYRSIDSTKGTATGPRDTSSASPLLTDGKVGTADRPCIDPDQHRTPCLDVSSVSRLMRADATRYIGDHLRELPRVVVLRNARVWGLFRREQAIGTGRFEGRRQWVTSLGFWVTWALVPVVAAGAVLLRRRGRSLVPFAASLAIVVVVTSVFYGLVRFRIPYDVASCLLVGVVVAEVVARTAAQRQRRYTSK